MINGLDGADALSGGTPSMVLMLAIPCPMRIRTGASPLPLMQTGQVRPPAVMPRATRLTNFENATGSAHDDNLNGEDDAATENTLKGLAGDDEIIGGAGSDTIEGGAGADEMDGGTTEDAGNGITIG